MLKYQSILLACLALPLSAETMRTGVVYREATSDAQLAEKHRKAAANQPLKKFTPAEGEDATKVHQVKSLLERSDVISFNGYSTLVPKRSIIHLPDHYQQRINHHEKGSKLVGWIEFLRLNRGWVSAVEVSFSQAKGETEMPPELLESFKKGGNLVVAVLQSGPISVAPPKGEEPNPSATETP